MVWQRGWELGDAPSIHEDAVAGRDASNMRVSLTWSLSGVDWSDGVNPVNDPCMVLKTPSRS
jgi:hypothetical protein